jgi:hypothetical protein
VLLLQRLSELAFDQKDASLTIGPANKILVTCP